MTSLQPQPGACHAAARPCFPYPRRYRRFFAHQLFHARRDLHPPAGRFHRQRQRLQGAVSFAGPALPPGGEQRAATLPGTGSALRALLASGTGLCPSGAAGQQPAPVHSGSNGHRLGQDRVFFVPRAGALPSAAGPGTGGGQGHPHLSHERTGHGPGGTHRPLHRTAPRAGRSARGPVCGRSGTGRRHQGHVRR